MTGQNSITIPKGGMTAFELLTALSDDQLISLGKSVSDNHPTSLDYASNFSRIAEELQISKRDMAAIVGHLMGLNHVRLERKISADELVKLLDEAVQNESSEDWQNQFGARWKAILPILPQLFRPNNLFSIARKTHELWANRPAKARNFKLVTDLRPVFDEDGESALAFVLTNTLIVEFIDQTSETERAIHISLDGDDLDSLSEEIGRARKKGRAIYSQLHKYGLDILTFGDE